MVADGTYIETIVLPAYSTNTGIINILAVNPGSVTIKQTDATIVTSYSGNKFAFYNLKFDLTINAVEEGTRGGISAFLLRFNTSLEIFGMQLTINMHGDFSNGLRYCNAISAQDYSSITFSAGDIDYSLTVNNPNDAQIYVFWGSNFGHYTFNGSNINNKLTWAVSGNLGSNGIFLRLSLNTLCFCQSGRTYLTTFSGSIQGQCYNVTGGSSCDTGGKGEEFFPGSTAGYVETLSYSWYK